MRRHLRQKAACTAVSEELVHRAPQGDTAAFEEIYRLTCARVYTQCLHLMRDAAEAEDLTQEVFLQLYRKIATYRGESAFSTRLHRVTLNCALMRFRRKTLLLMSMDEADNDATGHAEERPEFGREDTFLVRAPDRFVLHAAIDLLAPGYRMIFCLHDIFDYEHGEIAEILGCSAGNSKSQLHKARLIIRDQLLTWQAEQRALCRTRAAEAARSLSIKHGKRRRRTGPHLPTAKGLRFGGW